MQVLYSLYASTLKYSITDNIGIHGFADDHALEYSFKQAVDEIEKIIGLEEHLQDVKIWMDLNRLKINDAKTEFLLCGSRQQIPRCITSSLRVNNMTVKISQVIKYLGIWVDKNLSFKHQITAVCQKAIAIVIRLRNIRNALKVNACKVLMLGLVLSYLD